MPRRRSPRVNLLVHGVAVDPGRAGARGMRLPFLANGPVEIRLEKPLTVLVGENGSGKTTLLEAIAARCGIPPSGGGSYAESDDDRPGTALSDAVTVDVGPGRLPRGLFVRADRLTDIVGRLSARGALRMATTDEWRRLDEQSRGESMLSLLSAQLEASEALLYLLDEPEAALSPQRQLSLLCLLDEIHRDGRSQAVLATHSPILMSHPEADILWIDETGIARRPLEEIEHWQLMRRFLRDPEAYLRRLLGS